MRVVPRAVPLDDPPTSTLLQTLDPSPFSEEAWRLITRDLRLSSREAEITRRMLDDQKEHAIARQLGISAHTVHMHVGRLYRKLGVHSHVTLALRVVKSFLRMTVDPKTTLPPLCSNRTSGRCPLAR